MRLPHPVALAVVAGIAVLLAACGAATRPPEPTPADFIGISRELGPRGIIARDIVSGDAGCDDQPLAKTAISFTASGLDQPAPVRLYLYIFRNRAAYERNLGNVDSCARSYVSDPATYEKLEVSPYVVAGQGPWATSFRATLVEALTMAAGSGN